MDFTSTKKILARINVNRIENIISKALKYTLRLVWSIHANYKRAEKCHKLKESIKMVESAGSDIDKKKLTEEGE